MLSSVSVSESFVLSHGYLSDLVMTQYPKHPFQQMNVSKAEMRSLLAEYLGMSTAFPYLQAGACGPQILDAIQSNRPIKEDFELTSVIGSFLVWDELGGWYNTVQRGVRGLPHILNTKTFHANILKKDLLNLFGEEVNPAFQGETQKYLFALYQRLASDDSLVRVAAMVSFEQHAERMITELWASVQQAFQVEKNQLRYFAAHVGGSDPAEAYHVKMTESLMEKVVGDRTNEFEELFVDSYGLHINWCEAIKVSNSASEAQKF